MKNSANLLVEVHFFDGDEPIQQQLAESYETRL
jgi:hypothetical protein